MKIALPENIALLFHPHVDVPWSLVVILRNLTLDGKLCLRDDKKCCLCIISPSLAKEDQPENRHNVRAQQKEAVSDWLNTFSEGNTSASAYIENVA